jgi:hypothetical protein
MFRRERDDAVHIGIVLQKLDALLVHDPEDGASRIHPLQAGKERSRPEDVPHGRPFDEKDLFVERLVIRAVFTEAAVATGRLAFEMEAIITDHRRLEGKNEPYLCHKSGIKANGLAGKALLPWRLFTLRAFPARHGKKAENILLSI